jgi:hypothetical protein
MMHRPILHAAAIVLLAVAAASPGWAGTQFLSYQGEDAIHQGRGGEMKVVDGVDFWMRGSPPHRFQVLGSIEDERHKTGLIGAIVMSSLEKDIASNARRAGGDAVILADAHDNLLGTVGSGFGSFSGSGGWGYYNAFGSSTTITRPIESHASRFIVIKYLPDAPNAPPAPPLAAPAMQQDYDAAPSADAVARF